MSLNKSSVASDCKRIHLVANSHIDPVWLWDKYEGIDEVLNTFCSACDRLDEYPTLKFTASSLCFYQWVADYAPDVFERIRTHVRTGRWEIVGGWWIESDCNLPAEISFRKSTELSRAFVDQHFGGLSIPVAYSPDAFGHAASLPRILADGGFKYYLFCRPDESEKPDLPANLFYWEYQGSRVLCYRLKYHYSQGWSLNPEQLRRSLNDEDFVRSDVACYLFGVGDHGGGPTKAEIEFWMGEQTRVTYRMLKFSTCLEFFKEAEQIEDIPIYQGDLHYHAVGCYAVNRALKQSIRQAEHELDYTERVARAAGKDVHSLNPLWQTTIFNQFHDILPGSCSPNAAAQAIEEMGGVKGQANHLAYESLKAIAARTPVRCPQGEFRLFNSLPFPVTGPFEIESFMYFQPGAAFCDSQGRPVVIQEIPPSVICRNRRWMFVDTFSAQSEKSYAFSDQLSGEGLPVIREVFREGKMISTGNVSIEHPGLVTGKDGRELFRSLIQFAVIPDASDTWGHGIRGFGAAQDWFQPVSSAIQEGPLASFLCSRMEYDRSRVEMLFKLYMDLPFWDLDIRVEWQQMRSLLKMELELRKDWNTLIVQGPGGAILKTTQDREEPLHGWLLAGSLGILQTGAFAFDMQGSKLRITLIRSSLYGFHDPSPPDERAPLHPTDVGEHRFRFRFINLKDLEAEAMNRYWAAFMEPFRVIRQNV